MTPGDRLRNSQIWKSIFRHPAPVDRHNRVVVMLTNFVLHLHPVSLPKHVLRFSYTWYMGLLAFYLFLVETVTGVLLMFYYRPTLQWAYNDILALRDVTTLGVLREVHRWGAHAMVIVVWLHMYRVFLTGSYKRPREFNWCIGVLLLVATLLLSFTRLLAPLGPTFDVGRDRRLEHGPRRAPARPRRARPPAADRRRHADDYPRLRRPLRPVGRKLGRRRDPQPVLHPSLCRHSISGRLPDLRSLLAHSQRRRRQRTGGVVVSDGDG